MTGATPERGTPERLFAWHRNRQRCRRYARSTCRCELTSALDGPRDLRPGICPCVRTAAGHIQPGIKRSGVRVVASRLDLEASSPLLYLERLRFAGDEPLALDRVWLPASIAEPLLDAG